MSDQDHSLERLQDQPVVEKAEEVFDAKKVYESWKALPRPEGLQTTAEAKRYWTAQFADKQTIEGRPREFSERRQDAEIQRRRKSSTARETEKLYTFYRDKQAIRAVDPELPDRVVNTGASLIEHATRMLLYVQMRLEGIKHPIKVERALRVIKANPFLHASRVIEPRYAERSYNEKSSIIAEEDLDAAGSARFRIYDAEVSDEKNHSPILLWQKLDKIASVSPEPGKTLSALQALGIHVLEDIYSSELIRTVCQAVNGNEELCYIVAKDVPLNIANGSSNDTAIASFFADPEKLRMWSDPALRQRAKEFINRHLAVAPNIEELPIIAEVIDDPRYPLALDFITATSYSWGSVIKGRVAETLGILQEFDRQGQLDALVELSQLGLRPRDNHPGVLMNENGSFDCAEYVSDITSGHQGLLQEPRVKELLRINATYLNGRININQLYSLRDSFANVDMELLESYCAALAASPYFGSEPLSLAELGVAHATERMRVFINPDYHRFAARVGDLMGTDKDLSRMATAKEPNGWVRSPDLIAAYGSSITREAMYSSAIDEVASAMREFIGGEHLPDDAWSAVINVAAIPNGTECLKALYNINPRVFGDQSQLSKEVKQLADSGVDVSRLQTPLAKRIADYFTNVFYRMPVNEPVYISASRVMDAAGNDPEVVEQKLKLYDRILEFSNRFELIRIVPPYDDVLQFDETIFDGFQLPGDEPYQRELSVKSLAVFATQQEQYNQGKERIDALDYSYVLERCTTADFAATMAKVATIENWDEAVTWYQDYDDLPPTALAYYPEVAKVVATAQRVGYNYDAAVINDIVATPGGQELFVQLIDAGLARQLYNLNHAKILALVAYSAEQRAFAMEHSSNREDVLYEPIMCKLFARIDAETQAALEQAAGQNGWRLSYRAAQALANHSEPTTIVTTWHAIRERMVGSISLDSIPEIVTLYDAGVLPMLAEMFERGYYLSPDQVHGLVVASTYSNPTFIETYDALVAHIQGISWSRLLEVGNVTELAPHAPAIAEILRQCEANQVDISPEIILSDPAGWIWVAEHQPVLGYWFTVADYVHHSFGPARAIKGLEPYVGNQEMALFLKELSGGSNNKAKAISADSAVLMAIHDVLPFRTSIITSIESLEYDFPGFRYEITATPQGVTVDPFELIVAQIGIKNIIQQAEAKFQAHPEFPSARAIREGIERSVSQGKLAEIKEYQAAYRGVSGTFAKEAIAKVDDAMALAGRFKFMSGPELAAAVQPDVLAKLRPSLIGKPDPQVLAEVCKQVLEACYQPGSVEHAGFNDLYLFLTNGNTVEVDPTAINAIWSYMGDRTRHDVLVSVTNFVKAMEAADSVPGAPTDREIVLNMLLRAGTGTGRLAWTLRDIMQTVTPQYWADLKRISGYPGQPPALANPNQINLDRIKNEIRLFSLPQLQAELDKLGKDNPKLHAYGMELLQHPTINVDRIVDFLKNPDEFFASRTGAGETGTVVNGILTALEPRNYPGWSSAESRDAIVDGTYDRLNAFTPGKARWYIEPNFEESKVADAFKKLQDGLAEVQKNPTPEGLANVLQLMDSDFIRESSDTEIYQQTKRAIRERLFIPMVEAEVVAFGRHMQERGEKLIEVMINGAVKAGLPHTDNMSRELRIAMADGPTAFWRTAIKTGAADSLQLHFPVRTALGQQFKDEHELLSALAKQPKDMAGLLENARVLVDSIAAAHSKTYYELEVLKPSDPETATAGSTSGNCDAFGHGKKSHFMVNPGTAQMVLRRSVNGGEPKLIAQSTLTADRQIFSGPEQRKAFYETLHQNQRQGAAAFDAALKAAGITLSAQEFLQRWNEAPDQICLDSVEVPQNTKTDLHPRQILALLQQGFSLLGESIEQYQRADIVAGTQYSYLGEASLPRVKNTGGWVVPIAYSDNPHTIEQAVLIRERGSQPQAHERTGVRPLKANDAFTIAMMEEIAFSRSGGANHITGFMSMTRELWSAVLQAEHRDHNPTAFVDVVEDEAGKATYGGYLIAFERGNNEIYITDTATLEDRKGVGSRLLVSLLNSVATDPKLRNKTITLDARGKTSAQALSNPRSKAAMESLVFTGPDNVSVQYTLVGKPVDSDAPDALYSFRIVPEVIKK